MDMTPLTVRDLRRWLEELDGDLPIRCTTAGGNFASDVDLKPVEWWSTDQEARIAFKEAHP